MKVISIINHKGGVGKTSTVVNLAAGLAKQNKKVLVIDLDTQANLTHSIHGDLEENEACIANVIIDKNLSLESIVRNSSIKNVDIAPAGEFMYNLELQLHSCIGREFKLKKVIERSNTIKYDYCLIDNAPHIGLTAVNALVASQYYMIPVSAEYLPLVGLKNLLTTIDNIQPLNHTIQNVGFLLTMVNKRESISSDVEKILRDTFKDEVFKTIIRSNTKIKACPQKKQTVFDLETCKGKGWSDYENVTLELINRLEGVCYGNRC